MVRAHRDDDQERFMGFHGHGLADASPGRPTVVTGNYNLSSLNSTSERQRATASRMGKFSLQRARDRN